MGRSWVTGHSASVNSGSLVLSCRSRAQVSLAGYLPVRDSTALATNSSATQCCFPTRHGPAWRNSTSGSSRFTRGCVATSRSKTGRNLRSGGRISALRARRESGGRSRRRKLTDGTGRGFHIVSVMLRATDLSFTYARRAPGATCARSQRARGGARAPSSGLGPNGSGRRRCCAWSRGDPARVGQRED